MLFYFQNTVNFSFSLKNQAKSSSFQETRPSIIKESAGLELGSLAALDGGGGHAEAAHTGERSGLLRGTDQGPRDGRAVIHTDSD
jgi:hypothetical protein